MKIDAPVASFETSVAVPSLGIGLSQNYPNPFNPTTHIEFVVDRRSMAILTIHGVSGARISTLVGQVLDSGRYRRS